MPNSKKLSQQPVAPALLPGDRLPVLRRAADEADAAKRNPTAGAEAVAGWLDQVMSPNSSRSLLKEFRFYRKADRDADASGGACFETDLDWRTCCAFTVVKIEFYRERDTEAFRYQELVCVFDPSPTDPTHTAYVDGSFSGSRNPSKFVPATRDLLAHTTTFMDAVLALAYTNCDADPAASPAGSFPGQQFDALYQGKNCHFYCTRSTYDPAAPAGTTGQGPAWHYTVKQP